jgi:hypothetical protein
LNLDPVIISVSNIDNTGFTVRTLIVGAVNHRHQVGSVGAYSAGANASGNRSLNLYPSSGGAQAMGALLAQTGSATDVYTSTWEAPAGAGFVAKGTIQFDWMAIG